MFDDDNPMYFREDITNLQRHQKMQGVKPMGLCDPWDDSYFDR